MKDILEGLEYDSLVLNHNVHKINGTVTKVQNEHKVDVKVDAGAIWLVAGLGYLNKETPDTLLQASLDDTIIISKTKLIEFLSQKGK